MDYLQFSGAVDELECKSDFSKKGYYTEILDHINYIENIEQLRVDVEEEKGIVTVEYSSGDKYVSFTFEDPDSEDTQDIVGYLAVGAWTNERLFNSKENMDQIKQIVNLLLFGSFEELKREWSAIRKG